MVVYRLALGLNQAAGLVAFFRNPYFQMALEANPEDRDAALQLGYAWISAGELDQAGPVFAALIEQAKAAQDLRAEGRGLNGRADVLVAQGDGPGAQAAYQAGLAIAEGLAKRDPANTQWQRDLSVSHDRIGDVLVAQGDGPAPTTSKVVRPVRPIHQGANHE